MSEYAVLEESARFLTHVHLHYGHRPIEVYQEDKPTIVETLAQDERSPMYMALVNLATILQGKSSRLVMVWYLYKRSPRAWFEAYAASVWVLLRGTIAFAAGIERRQRRPMKELEIFAIHDPA